MTYRRLVHLFVKLEHISKFIRSREDDQFVGRSQINLMCSLLWHLAFLHHLTHPRVSTEGWHKEDLYLRELLLPSSQTEVVELHAQLDESRRYLRQQIVRRKDRAEQQVKARNSQEALQQQGLWMSIDWMSAMAKALNEEGWARMRRLEVVLSSTPLPQYVLMLGSQRAQFDWLRDWLVFSLFVDIPPMRPQNGELQIIKHPELAGCRRTNGLLFFKSRVSLQIVRFKNAAFMGEHVIDLPSNLRDKLLAYMRFVRPSYAFNSISKKKRTSKTKNTNEEEEEAAEDIESDKEDLDTDDDDDNDEAVMTCQSTRSSDTDELDDNISQWHTQSPWLFLKPGIFILFI